MRGDLPGIVSARVGAYRVLYEISDATIDVIHVAHRADVYRSR